MKVVKIFVTNVLNIITNRVQAPVRNFIQKFKGQPLNAVYEKKFKDRGQNFINNGGVKGANTFDYEIDETYFEKH